MCFERCFPAEVLTPSIVLIPAQRVAAITGGGLSHGSDHGIADWKREIDVEIICVV